MKAQLVAVLQVLHELWDENWIEEQEPMPRFLNVHMTNSVGALSHELPG